MQDDKEPGIDPAEPEAPAGSTKRLFSAEQVALATWLGLPLAGCWLLAVNSRALGKPEQQWMIWPGGVVLTAICLWLLFTLPETFPIAAVPFVYAGLSYITSLAIHGKAFEQHIKAGGAQQSYVGALAVGFVGLIPTLMLFIALEIHRWFWALPHC